MARNKETMRAILQQLREGRDEIDVRDIEPDPNEVGRQAKYCDDDGLLNGDFWRTQDGSSWDFNLSSVTKEGEDFLDRRWHSGIKAKFVEKLEDKIAAGLLLGLGIAFGFFFREIIKLAEKLFQRLMT
jgi:hypothetical protein